MKEFIMDRLAKMEDLQQRSVLRNLMSGIFLNLVEHQEEMNRRLERRVFDEVTDHGEKHDLFVSMCRREDWDPLHDYLFPMLPEDTQPRRIDLKEVIAGLREGGEVTISPLYLECGYSLIRRLLLSGRTFGGMLRTDKGLYPVRAKLERNMAYIQEIEKLYHIFLRNGLPWKTVNHPYAYKFVNVVLIGVDGSMGPDEEVLELTVHLEEYEAYKRADLVPLWNIQRLEMNTVGFPMPAGDHIHFEHVLPLNKSGLQHGYLVDTDDPSIRYIKRSPGELTIVSSHENSNAWQILKLVEPVQSGMSKQSYPLMSNRQRSDFIGNFGRRQAQIVRSKGEITRLIHSYDISDWLELEKIAILPPGDDEGVVTYELNRFISDEVRVDNGKWRMRLTFGKQKLARELQYLAEDLVSFLVSEVQLLFPEYRCEGEWA
ncbi:hypothetical protein [Paenibacillus ginsengihumi]|uniref:hypothetical protein n=1 Tax=Paenibacillus ginsengihumi TaxID=431596 RepID=UPI00036B9893|nr:hypothetical protein [Paenibacillus ginsengihumi]